MPLYLNESLARKHFKDALGSANHLLVTILVGLVAVEDGLITECPAELHAAWNPKDPVASANRSRIMALEMALVRATDSLDIYIRFARRKPSIISDIELQKEIDGSNRSIFRKFNAIRRRFLDADDEVKAIAALIEVMIVWRNRMVHSDEDNEVEPKSWETLRKSASWIKNEFRGMEVDRLFSDFKSETPPKFKEIASFIRATHEAVRITDASLLKSLDPESFLKRLISVKAGRAIPSLDESASRAKQVQSIWGRDESSRPQKILSFLKNCGLSEAATAGGSFAATFPDNLIAALASKTPKEASEWLDVPMMPEEK